jgi:hypothetical protein
MMALADGKGNFEVCKKKKKLLKIHANTNNIKANKNFQ